MKTLLVPPAPVPARTDEETHAAAALFRALGDPARVQIVRRLAASDGPCCVCELVPELGLAQPTVSHHLKKLTDVGLLEREERGKWAYYSLSRETLRRLASLVAFEEVRA